MVVRHQPTTVAPLLFAASLLLAHLPTEAAILGHAAAVDPAAALQQKIDAAIASRAPLLSIAAGDYHFGNRTLLIQHATNLELRAAGPVTVWFTNTDGGILLRRCTNVSIIGHDPSQPLRVDRSPPPWSQGTVTKIGAASFEFTLDGDSADPRTIQPVRMNEGMIGPECASWRKGSQASDNAERPWSRGLPNGAACPTHNKLTELGPRHFSSPFGRHKPDSVGDQFVLYAWKGMSYVVANSSRVLTQDLAIHAAGDMAIAEIDGTGAHVFRRVVLAPRNGRIISSNADAFHSSDMDKAATLEDCRFRSMLDDFMNFQTTLLFAIPAARGDAGSSGDGSSSSGDGGSSGAGETTTTSWTLVHPHVSDQPDDVGDDGRPVVDHWYGTSEPLSRVQAGEDLIFFDPVHFGELGRATTASAPTLLSPASDQNSSWAKHADSLVHFLRDGPDCLKPHAPTPCVPYNYGGEWGNEPGAAVTGQPFQASVYSVELQQPPPAQTRPGAMAAIPYVVQIAKTQSKGAVVRDCVFEDSTGFFARWKSSHALMENNIFRGNGFPIIEMQVLPSFYEGPPHTRNVTLRNNSFGVGDADSSFQKDHHIPANPHGAWQKGVKISDIVDVGPAFCEVEGLEQEGNSVFCDC